MIEHKADGGRIVQEFTGRIDEEMKGMYGEQRETGTQKIYDKDGKLVSDEYKDGRAISAFNHLFFPK